MTFRYVGSVDGLQGEDAAEILDRSGADLDDAMESLRALRADVRARGDAAVLEAEARFGASPRSIEVPRAEIEAAARRVPGVVRGALASAMANLERFHRRQLRRGEESEVVPGLLAGRRFLPVRRVGCYVPGGRAAYPSTVLMTTVPARVAGVDEVFVATPPGAGGVVPDVTLAACSIAGVDRVFAMGGAQAIFALAHGTATVPAVDKLVGPGSVWVTAAKLLVSGRVGIDLPAGPSEVLVVADASADARAVAWDLLAQAEHDPLAAVALVTWDAALMDEVRRLVPEFVAACPRKDIIAEALRRRGALLLAPDRATALAFADRYAPEHLVLATASADKDLEAVRSYGSAFLGPWSAVTLGDYCSGTNHVLPTGGLARAGSGLAVDDFLRRSTHQRATREGLVALAPVAIALAETEGLPAHAEAVRVRLSARGPR